MRLTFLSAGCLILIACTGVIDDPLTGDPLKPPPGQIDPSQDLAPPLRAISPVVHRLTRDEYSYTVLDLLGISLGDSENPVPVDRPVEGFVNIATGQTASPDHVLAYHQTANAIVSKNRFLDVAKEDAGCTETTMACAESLATKLGARLFRRPLEAREIQSYVDLFVALDSDQVSFDERVRSVGLAMLQSPNFLYVLHDEARGDRDDYTFASKLSYFLWSSAPDTELLDAAKNGALESKEEIEAQVERMLQDETKMRRSVARFIIDWTGLESIPDEDGLKGDLVKGAVAFYVDATMKDRDLYDLFKGKTMYLTPDLAAEQGFANLGSGVQAYEVEQGRSGGGILGQPGVIAGMTNADGGEIVARGLFLQRQLFCGATPDPPDSLAEDIEAFTDSLPDDASARQIAETRLTREECAACHAVFDPLAYAFEEFDSRGTFRSEDEFGNVVQNDGWIPATHTDDRADKPYDDFDGFMAELSGNRRIRRCFTQRQLEYATGSRLNTNQTAAVFEISDAMQEVGGSYKSLAKAIVTHDVFRQIGAQGDEQ